MPTDRRVKNADLPLCTTSIAFSTHSNLKVCALKEEGGEPILIVGIFMTDVSSTHAHSLINHCSAIITTANCNGVADFPAEVNPAAPVTEAPVRVDSVTQVANRFNTSIIRETMYHQLTLGFHLSSFLRVQSICAIKVYPVRYTSFYMQGSFVLLSRDSGVDSTSKGG